MVSVWPHLDEASRLRLIGVILAEPPITDGEATGGLGDEDRKKIRDHAVFLRLGILDRIGDPPLPQVALARLSQLKRTYPKWTIDAGDRPHFSVWSSNHDDIGSDYTIGDLARLPAEKLFAVLRASDRSERGLLDAWEHAVRARPGRAVGVLRLLAARPSADDHKIWRETLFGLRDAVARPAVARRVFAVLTTVDESLLRMSALLSPVSDLVELAARSETHVVDDAVLCRLWDRLIEGVLCSEDSGETPEDDDWIGLALNRPIGRLTTALLDILFRRGLRTGEELPRDIRERMDRLVATEPLVLRLARVVLASRLVYLFAVNSSWVVSRLLNFLDWERCEDGAVALWRGYAWHGRINADLWAAIRQRCSSEVDPIRGTTAAASLIGNARLRLVPHATRIDCRCCGRCGDVGDAPASSKRSVMSTALPGRAPVTPARQTAIGVRLPSA